MAPIPKRSDQLIRRNKVENPVSKVYADGQVRVPALGIKDPHPLVRALYRSLKTSAQSRFFEDSDWQYARVTMFFLDDLLKKNTKSSMMLATIDGMLTQLLLTEAERRRARLEIERSPEPQVEDFNTVADLFRQRLTS